jgi:hypothetical protein
MSNNIKIIRSGFKKALSGLGVDAAMRFCKARTPFFMNCLVGEVFGRTPPATPRRA